MPLIYNPDDTNLLKKGRSTKLVKSTNFLPRESENIQIGSLKFYRKSDNKEIADEREGYVVFSIDFGSGVVVSYEWLNDIMFGLLGHLVQRDSNLSNVRFFSMVIDYENLVGDSVPGEMRVDVGAVSFSNIGTESIRVGGQLILEYRAFNSLIFCCSHLPEEFEISPENRIFKGYKAYWTLEIEGRHSFAEFLARAVSTSIRQDQLFRPISGGRLVPFQGDVDEINIFQQGFGMPKDGLNLIYTKYPVLYSDRVFHIASQLDMSPQQLRRILFDSPYLKHLRDLGQKEYRIMFRFVHSANGAMTFLAFGGDWLRVPIGEITDLIKDQVEFPGWTPST
jgi:hypothetical protein